MPYEGKVIHAAMEALRSEELRHRGEFDRRRMKLYRQSPRLQEIDRLLSKTVRDASMTALQQGVDPMPALERARRENQSLQQERGILLTEMGCAPDALTYRPLCPLCNDRGWIGSEMCQCLRQRCAREQIKALSSMLNLGDQSFDTFDLSYYSQLYDATISTSPRRQMELVLDVCYAFADKFGRGRMENLFLTGAPGLGKTFLSAAIARVVSEKGYSVVYDSAVNVFSRFEADKFSRDAEAAADVNRYLTCDLMILDDLGSEMNSPMVQASLYQLVNTRLLNQRKTVISSNLSLNDISARYAPQIASRLSGDYTPLFFYGEDIRQQKRARYGR